MTRASAEAGLHEFDTRDAVRMRTAKFAVATHLLHIIALFQCGGLLLDPRGNVLSLNPIAAASLGNGLVVRGNRLGATDRASDARLQNAVKLVLNLTGSAEVPATTIEIHRIGHLPLLTHFLRLDESIRSVLHGASLLLVTFDPEIRRAPRADILTQLFDLTPAEADVAIGIAGGKRAPEIATDRGVKIDTVRTQSKAALSKTGSQNQVELAALLTRVAFFGPQHVTNLQQAQPPEDLQAILARVDAK
jgi:DNA-binding NarL/FixJ family response regulator